MTPPRRIVPRSELVADTPTSEPQHTLHVLKDRDERNGALTTLQPSVQERMATVRETFRLRRLASVHRGLWMFYLEHNLFDEAEKSRHLMVDNLRRACQQWRLTLGMDR